MIKREVMRKMEEKGFALNPMQKQTASLAGENIVINAPTGSGKTEAILLNLKKGSYYYFLPTITSCMFMYRRLKELEVCSVEIRTSLLAEKADLRGSDVSITITTPDPVMIGYLKGESIRKGLILDELDNYPTMVKSAILDYVKHNPTNHIIVASATLDKQLESFFENFTHIDYNVNMKLIKHKVEVIWHPNDIVDVIRRNPDKKIGIIRNSISDIRDLAYLLDFDDVKYKVLHSNLTEVERLEAEKDLYEGNFKVFLSNDIVSYSVDVDFDILFMDCSDKTSVNLQRLGRCNRRNKRVNYKNVYIMDEHLTNYSLAFIDEYDQRDEIERFKDELCSITYNKISKLKNSLKFEELPTVDYIVNVYWKELEELGVAVNLRKVPINFKLETIFERKVYNKTTKKLDIEEIPTFKVFKANGDFPWSRYPYDEDGNKKYVYLSGSCYEIIKKDARGDFLIKKFYGEGYSEEDFEENEFDDDYFDDDEI